MQLREVAGEREAGLLQAWQRDRTIETACTRDELELQVGARLLEQVAVALDGGHRGRDVRLEVDLRLREAVLHGVRGGMHDHRRVGATERRGTAARHVEENIRQLVELTTAVEKESGATARLLWS